MNTYACDKIFFTKIMRHNTNFSYLMKYVIVQVNLCQKLLFLHQLTQKMMTDCSLNYKFNT